MNPIDSRQAVHPVPVHREPGENHFENVYNKYFRKVYGICRRYSAEHDDARDLAHDVFVQYFLNFKRFRHESSPSTWMYRVAVNLAIQRWRKNKARLNGEKDPDAITDGTGDNESLMLDRIALAKILGRYPERTRRIFSLFHIERMTQVEIGKMLGISRATVTRHLIPLKRFR